MEKALIEPCKLLDSNRTNNESGKNILWTPRE